MLDEMLDWFSPALIKQSIGSSFKFHLNLFFKRIKINFFPSFPRKIFLCYWKKLLAGKPKITTYVLS